VRHWHAEEKRETHGWKHHIRILECTLKKETWWGGCIDWIHLDERGKWQCAVHMVKKLQIPLYAGIFLFSGGTIASHGLLHDTDRYDYITGIVQCTIN